MLDECCLIELDRRRGVVEFEERRPGSCKPFPKGETDDRDIQTIQKASGSPSYFTYILKGGIEENWEPQFSYTGFRYMLVQCIPKYSGKPLPVVKNIEGLHIRNAAPTIGSFTSSANELFNITNTLIDWANKSNTVSVFTDCPRREKLGWLEQTHLTGASVQYNYDIASLNRKVIKDMMNANIPMEKFQRLHRSLRYLLHLLMKAPNGAVPP